MKRARAITAQEPTSSMDEPDASPALKAFGLLAAIAGMDHAPTLAELTEVTALPKPTLHRWISMLEGADMVHRLPDGRRYELGSRATSLAFSILSNNSSSTQRHQILQGVVDDLGESLQLHGAARQRSSLPRPRGGHSAAQGRLSEGFARSGPLLGQWQDVPGHDGAGQAGARARRAFLQALHQEHVDGPRRVRRGTRPLFERRASPSTTRSS